MSDAAQRREQLKAVWQQASTCTRCPQLAAARQSVVFGAGNADAALMFVGEAPGANEDRLGLPFVGQAGRLLDQLLAGIGLSRAEVFIANTLKCLSYDALVQLGDGSWERIGRLVGSRYSGTVMSLEDDGTLRPRRVTGWHATPLGDRRVLRLTYRNAENAGAGKVDVELTGDHPVLTERGYVAAGDLRAGDRIATGHGLSDVARDVICGSLLGEASIGARSSCLTCSHSAAQADYPTFKASLVDELSSHVAQARVALAGGGRRYDVVHVRTGASPALRLLRADFYRPDKLVPPWIATELNARMLAFWFMDDGYLRVRSGKSPLAEIATDGFSDDDRQVLLQGLMRLGLPAKASRGRIYFNVSTSRRLGLTIAPFVPPSMRHKLVPEVAHAVPFRPDLLRAGPPRVLYDEVEIEDVTDRPRADRTFFCLDVDGTHNFVTGGGVVHNCRPPGNRDPLPQEIDNCQDYLFRQLELIQPRVVCTLGNFATKLLRADTATGITRLHGREELRRIGPRVVRLYPLYHPAAALYTPAMLATLKEDFAGIPALLALPEPEQPAPEQAEAVVPEPEELVRAAAGDTPGSGAEPGAAGARDRRPAEESKRAGDAGPAGEPDREAPGEPEAAVEPVEAQLGLF